MKEIGQLLLLVFITVASCRSLNQNTASYWASMKDKFRHKNLNEFVCDSLMIENIKSSYKVRHRSIDTIFSSRKVYLYSWQERDSSKIEFTVVDDKDEQGISISYLIFEKNGRLMSVTKLAGKGIEAHAIYEIRSRIINRDSIFQIQSITETYDFENDKKGDKPIGDSTFLSLTIDANGMVTERTLKEVKELNYGNK